MIINFALQLLLPLVSLPDVQPALALFKAGICEKRKKKPTVTMTLSHDCISLRNHKDWAVTEVYIIIIVCYQLQWDYFQAVVIRSKVYVLHYYLYIGWWCPPQVSLWEHCDCCANWAKEWGGHCLQETRQPLLVCLSQSQNCQNKGTYLKNQEDHCKSDSKR